MMQAMPDDLVTIATFSDSVMAEAAKGFLHAQGVRAFVMDSHVNNLTPRLLSQAVGVRLQVPRSEVEDAMALLEEISGGESWEAEPDDASAGGPDEGETLLDDEDSWAVSGPLPGRGVHFGQDGLDAGSQGTDVRPWSDGGARLGRSRASNWRGHLLRLLLVVAVVLILAAIL